jgi:hypothetical protein
MNTRLSLAPDTAYTLSPDLREPAGCDAVHRSEPNETDREELLLRKLGARGWGRVHQFRYYFGQGWGESSRPALSPKALDAFFRFLVDVDFPSGKQPSVFLTDEGGLELVWEDEAGQSIQVDFRPKRIEYYRAGCGEEGSAPFAELRELARRLSV